jgi:hypothetical protein
MPDETKQPTTNAPPQSITDLPAGGGVVVPGGGGVVTAPVGGGLPPIPGGGGVTLGSDTDVEDKLKKAVPAFGNVLAAIGGAVADSQKSLDKAVIDSINKLNDTKITVMSQLEIELGEDGAPNGIATPITNEVSVLQYYTPVFHCWKRVDIAMDVTVADFHETQGVSFKSKQSSTSVAGGLSWNKGWGGWFTASHSESQQSAQVNTQVDVEWTSGQLLVDAEMGPRPIAKFAPATVISVGPQLMISQGQITDVMTGTQVTGRKVQFEVQSRKFTGEPNSAQTIEVDYPPTLPGIHPLSIVTDAGGKATFELRRDISGPTGFRQFPLTIALGDIKQSYTLTI